MHTLKKRELPSNILRYVLLLLGGAVSVMPMIYMISTSLKPNGALYEFPPKFFPALDTITIENYVYIFSQEKFYINFLNSVIVAVLTVVIAAFVSSALAFCLARFRFPGRKIFMLSFLLTNAFPKLGIYTSIGILFYKYNLMGTLLGVVIIHMINSMMFMVWLPCSAFQAVHKQQEEAARDVGAGPIRTFFQVSFPMAMPGIMVATLYTFLGSMEEAQGTLLVGLARIKTMPVEMYGIILDYPGQAGAVFAILLMIPAAVMIFAMKKYIGPEAIAGGFKMK